MLRAICDQISDIHDLKSFMLASSKIYLKTVKSEGSKLAILKPYNHAYVALCSTRVRKWAESDYSNELGLELAIESGMTGLRELCEKVAPATMEELAWLDTISKNVIDRVTALVAPLYFANVTGDPSSPIYQHVRKALFNFWIYCQLFKNDLEHTYQNTEGANTLRPLPKETRRNFLYHCVPDDCDICTAEVKSDRKWLRSVVETEVFYNLFDNMEDPRFGGPVERESSSDFIYNVFQNSGLKTLQLLARDTSLSMVKNGRMQIREKALGPYLADYVKTVLAKGEAITGDNDYRSTDIARSYVGEIKQWDASTLVSEIDELDPVPELDFASLIGRLGV